MSREGKSGWVCAPTSPATSSWCRRLTPRHRGHAGTGRCGRSAPGASTGVGRWHRTPYSGVRCVRIHVRLGGVDRRALCAGHWRGPDGSAGPGVDRSTADGNRSVQGPTAPPMGIGPVVGSGLAESVGGRYSRSTFRSASSWCLPHGRRCRRAPSMSQCRRLGCPPRQWCRSRLANGVTESTQRAKRDQPLTLRFCGR